MSRKRTKGGSDSGGSSWLPKQNPHFIIKRPQVFSYKPPDDECSIGRFFLNNHYFAMDDDSKAAQIARKELGNQYLKNWDSVTKS